MKSALILGATSDIAMAIAHKLAENGYAPILAARNANRLADAANDINIRYQVQSTTVDFDALAYDSHVAFYDALPTPPDVVVCAFGYLGEQEKAQADFAEARQIIDTNFTGAASILEIVARDFEQRKQGAIVGISSVAGDRGRQSNYMYGSAKAGFTAYLSGLRNRLNKSGVSVMTVKPGFVRTKMTAGMPLPAPVTADPSQTANDVYRGLVSGADEVYTLWMWRYIMLIIQHIPEIIFKRLKL